MKRLPGRFLNFEFDVDDDIDDVLNVANLENGRCTKMTKKFFYRIRGHLIKVLVTFLRLNSFFSALSVNEKILSHHL